MALFSCLKIVRRPFEEREPLGFIERFLGKLNAFTQKVYTTQYLVNRAELWLQMRFIT